jgi:hypothetical protein
MTQLAIITLHISVATTKTDSTTVAADCKIVVAAPLSHGVTGELERKKKTYSLGNRGITAISVAEHVTSAP